MGRLTSRITEVALATGVCISVYSPLLSGKSSHILHVQALNCYRNKEIVLFCSYCSELSLRQFCYLPGLGFPNRLNSGQRSPHLGQGQSFSSLRVFMLHLKVLFFFLTCVHASFEGPMRVCKILRRKDAFWCESVVFILPPHPPSPGIPFKLDFLNFRQIWNREVDLFVRECLSVVGQGMVGCVRGPTACLGSKAGLGGQTHQCVALAVTSDSPYVFYLTFLSLGVNKS